MPASLATRLKLLRTNLTIKPQYFSKVVRLLTTSLMLQPLDFFEGIRYNKAINNTPLDQEHIHILGHWRSGTTHLHNLMVQDPRYAFASTFQVVFPSSFKTLSHFRWFLDKLVPETRQFDNAKVSFDLPQEDEVALAYLSPYSIYHGFFYPNQLEEYCEKYVTLEGISPNELETLKKQYTYFIKKVLHANKNKPLILKNPINTGRIPLLLEITPNAKFVYIYRNPYKAALSEAQALKLMVDQYTLEDYQYEDLENSVIANYKRMMNAYLNQKNRIPKGNLVEIKFEDLMKSPLEQVEKIYEALNLKDFNQAKQYINTTIQQEKHYQHNTYQFTQSTINNIQSQLDFVLKEWHYPVPTAK